VGVSALPRTANDSSTSNPVRILVRKASKIAPPMARNSQLAGSGMAVAASTAKYPEPPPVLSVGMMLIE
jgi:hypothetical protein